MNYLRQAFLLLMAGITVFQCGKNIAGTGTEVGNPRKQVYGKIVDKDGLPVAGATVRIVPVDFDPRQVAKRLAKTRKLDAVELATAILADMDTATTNDSGYFGFDSIDGGTYNFLADSGAEKLAYQDSVDVAGDDTTVVDPDTLKEPGTLTGVVSLQPEHDSRTIFIIALGTGRLFNPADSVGNFTMSAMAEGQYSMRILTTLDDYAVLDTAFTVRAGATDTLADTIKLRYTGIPIPRQVTTSYDTLTNTATLSWAKPVAGRPVQGYNVYRRQGTSGQFATVNASLVADTVFVDSLGNGLEKGETYQYYVVALDTNSNAGDNSATVSAVVAFYIDAGKDTTYQVGDSITLKGQVNTGLLTAAEYRWDVNADGTNELASASVDSLVHAYLDTGTYKVVFSVKDGNDAVFTDTMVLTIIPKDTAGAPSAPRGLSLTYDTLKQLVTLTWAPNFESDVQGYNVYRKHQDSSFVKIKGDVADTTWTDSTLAETATYEYKVAAVDAQDAEGALSVGDSVAFVNRVKLASNSAEFGTRYRHTSVVFDSKIWVIGGINSSGHYSNDVWYSPSGSTWTVATNSAAFPKRNGHASVVFANSIWVIGGVNENGDELSDVWSSSDGVNWTQATASGGFAVRRQHAAVVHNDTIWVVGGGHGASALFNDVWYSTDGTTWSQASSSADFSARSGHSLVSFGGQMWVIGGVTGATAANDAWYSSNGITWTQATASDDLERGNHSGIVQDSLLWVTGGRKKTNGDWVALDNLRYSSDGVQWSVINTPPEFAGKHSHTSVLYNNRIWIIGGTNTQQGTDIWYYEL